MLECFNKDHYKSIDLPQRTTKMVTPISGCERKHVSWSPHLSSLNYCINSAECKSYRDRYFVRMQRWQSPCRTTQGSFRIRRKLFRAALVRRHCTSAEYTGAKQANTHSGRECYDGAITTTWEAFGWFASSKSTALAACSHKRQVSLWEGGGIGQQCRLVKVTAKVPGGAPRTSAQKRTKYQTLRDKCSEEPSYGTNRQLEWQNALEDYWVPIKKQISRSNIDVIVTTFFISFSQKYSVLTQTQETFTEREPFEVRSPPVYWIQNPLPIAVDWQ